MPPPNTPEEGLLPPGSGIRHHIQPIYDDIGNIIATPDRVEQYDGIRIDQMRDAESVTNPARTSIEDDRLEPSLSPAQTPLSLPVNLDWPALEYVGEVSQNLWCPICQSPLVLPVLTRCGHVFCSECFDGLLEHSNKCCPLDRKSFSRDLDRGRFPAKTAPRIIQNLLDELQVRCPNRRCGKVEVRGAIKQHYEKECQYTKVTCSRPSCRQPVTRMDYEGGCKHMIVQCPQCYGLIDASEADEHYENDCTVAPKDCEHCSASVPRNRYAVHLQQDCPDIDRPCEHAAAGCKFVTKRCSLGEHERGCVFGAVARVEQSLRRDILSLQDLAAAQQAKLQFQETIIQDLTDRTANLHVTTPNGDALDAPGSTGLPSRPISEGHAGPPRRIISAAQLSGDVVSLGRNTSVHDGGSYTRVQWSPSSAAPYHGDNMQNDAQSFILAGLTSCEDRVENLQRRLAEQDARQSQMLVNEILPVQDQLTELRTAISGIGMDLRFVIARQKSMYSGNGNRLNGTATNTVASVGSGTLPAAPEPSSSGQDARANYRVNDHGFVSQLAITPPRL